jgi:uncharacterized damage-inducible protein DinB
MKDHFIQLYQFNRWANGLVIESINEHASENSKILGLMSHIVLAQENWLRRVSAEQNDVPVWQLLPIQEVKSRSIATDQAWLNFLESISETELGATHFYTNMAGEPQQNTLEDIITHVANHGTYHRAQIVLLLRGAGIVPPSTDFIRYRRISK